MVTIGSAVIVGIAVWLALQLRPPGMGQPDFDIYPDTWVMCEGKINDACAEIATARTGLSVAYLALPTAHSERLVAHGQWVHQDILEADGVLIGVDSGFASNVECRGDPIDGHDFSRGSDVQVFMRRIDPSMADEILCICWRVGATPYFITVIAGRPLEPSTEIARLNDALRYSPERRD